MKTREVRVSSKSSASAAAKSISIIISEGNRCVIKTIGAGALNQAVKAVAIARGLLAIAGIELICFPTFEVLQLEKEVTAINITVEKR